MSIPHFQRRLATDSGLPVSETDETRDPVKIQSTILLLLNAQKNIHTLK